MVKTSDVAVSGVENHAGLASGLRHPDHRGPRLHLTKKRPTEVGLVVQGGNFYVGSLT